MKYCSKCNKVYPDGVECECTKKEPIGFYDKKAEMVDLDCEPKCKCGSTEDLKYHAACKFITCDRTEPSYCTCKKCDNKLQARIEREESMKYLIIDYNQPENKFCDDKDEVEKFLKYHIEDYPDSGELTDVLILKLEPLDRYRLKEEDFKPGREWDSGLNEFVDKRAANNHLVFWDGEEYRVEEVIVPSIEYESGPTLNW